MKRIVLFILTVCMLCAVFSGCGGNGNNSTADHDVPAGDITDADENKDQAAAGDDGQDVDATESSDISGSFIREDGRARLMFYSESGLWFVEGDAQSRDPETCKMNNGSISGHIDGEGTSYYFDDGEAKAKFEFSEDASELEVKTEDTEAFGGEDFSGIYRLNDGGEALNYYDLESAGYMAAAMYMAGKDDTGDFSYSSGETDNDLATAFLENYTDLYFAPAAAETEGIDDGEKYYPYDENYLNILLNTAFSERFGTDKLITENSGIIYNANMYYVPSFGRVSGSVAFEYAPISEGTVNYSVSLISGDGETYERVLSVTLAPGVGENNFTITEITIL